ncbi:MAG: NAD(P)-dependent oxidoreductase [Alkalilacustris sp.]
MRHLLIIGASGGIGRHAVDLALAAGHRVRAVARNTDGLDRGHPGLEARNLDATDRDGVRAALDGVDAVIQAIGMAPSLRRMLAPVDLFSRSTEVLVCEMARAGVDRLVAITGFGAGDSRVAFSPPERLLHRLVLGTVYADKDRQEEIIRASALDWLILRPTVLTDGAGGGRVRLLASPRDWRNGLIARRDVAGVAVREAAAPRHSRMTPVLTY